MLQIFIMNQYCPNIHVFYKMSRIQILKFKLCECGILSILICSKIINVEYGQIGSTLACKLYLTHIISFFVTFFLFLFRWGPKMSTRGFSILNFRRKTIENSRNLDIYWSLFHVFGLLCWYSHTYFICIWHVIPTTATTTKKS